MLPDDIKGELPTIAEIEQRMDEELKENRSSVDARWDAIKKNLTNIHTDEIQTPVTYNILLSLFINGLKPLYEEIIKKMDVFKTEFHDKMFVWNCTNKVILNMAQLEEFWNDETQLKNIHQISFSYNLFGFKKAGIENFNEHLQLNFEINTYSYGFTLVNHNNQQPFLKKLYHQPITSADQQQIIDLIMMKVMDGIEWNLERIKK